MKTIGFAGTAKNTGKTSSALLVMDQCEKARLRTALTSIGYDGEEIDTVTGLPKPRYIESEGMFIATAESCLKASTAVCRVLEVTRVQTILGPVVLAEVVRSGQVLLAGPNRTHDLKTILRSFFHLGMDTVLVDGALNRLAPLIGADGLVLATGAAFDTNIEAVAEHAGAVAHLFELPLSPYQPAQGRPGGIHIQFVDQPDRRLHTGSLLSSETLSTLVIALTGRVRSMTIPGACNPILFSTILDMCPSQLEGASFNLGGPLKLIASGDPRRWEQILATLDERGQSISYLEKIPLKLVTANPFYPRYITFGKYEPAEVDKDRLIRALRARVTSVPVFNLRETPTPSLLPLLGLAQMENENA